VKDVFVGWGVEVFFFSGRWLRGGEGGVGGKFFGVGGRKIVWKG